MINLYKQDGETLYGIKEFLLDSQEDVKNLPIEKVHVGSIALVISSGELYVFNGNKEWTMVGGGEK